jgi:rod shape-determining protein MreD
VRQYSVANWRDKRNIWRVILSLSLSMVLSTLPIGGLWSKLFPNLAMLAMLYWGLNAQRLESPLGLAFVVGLIYDWLYGGIYGAHSLAFVLLVMVSTRNVVYFQTATKAQQIVRVFVVLALIEISIFGLIELFTAESVLRLTDLYQVALTALMWPAMRFVLSFKFRTR